MCGAIGDRFLSEKLRKIGALVPVSGKNQAWRRSLGLNKLKNEINLPRSFHHKFAHNSHDSLY
jgi:hypothetical protein